MAWRQLLVGAALALGAFAGTWAQPADVVRIVVPFPPGGVTDGLARLFASRLGETGQKVVVDNKPGANGIIGAQAVLAAPADGRTFYVTSPSSVASNVALLKKLPYDPLKDFVPVARLFRTHAILVTGGNSPYRNVADLVAAGKAQPLSFAAVAPGYTLMYESVRKAVGINSLVVNYKGGAPALQDVMGGFAELALTDPSAAYSLIGGGKLRALAVVKDTRDPLLPDVPTTVEVGAGQPPIFQWTGVFAKAGTPRDAVEKFAAQLARVAKDPAVLEWAKANGVSPFWGHAAALAEQQRSDIKAYRELMLSAGLEAE